MTHWNKVDVETQPTLVNGIRVPSTVITDKDVA